MTRHPVRVEYDAVEGIFALAALHRNIAWLENLAAQAVSRTSDGTAVPAVLAAVCSAADKLEKALYGDPTLADGDHYARPPQGCTCSQSWDAKHAPGCLLFEDVRGWDDTRASA
jgi:hypothetical protein